jgi:hypothetical protein
MSSQSNELLELNRADTSEAPTTGEDRFANRPYPTRRATRARRDLSPEAFALCTSMGAQLVAACRGAKKEPALQAANHRHEA